MSPNLLLTKLFVPPARPNLVNRSHLVNRLNEGLHPSRKLTLVSAPAGYGKTTLVTEWLRGIQGKKAWLSLDEFDNDPIRFLTYLIAALHQIDGRISEKTGALLHMPQTVAPEVVLTTLCNEIVEAQLSFILVLDDYHLISGLPIHQYVNFLVEHGPPEMHLVIISREDPLLPVARLRARGQVLEIRQDELRFTPDEVNDFLGRVMGLSLSSDEIAALDRCTEGWITGLQLAALSMQGRENISNFIQDFTGSSRYVLDYLIEEVFERQAPDVKDFLLKTSILDRFTGSLCEALAENTNSDEMIGRLEKANLFIVPLDQSRVWYRYHHLFSELLRHRLRVSYPDDEIKLHQQASSWFEAEGLTGEAVHHALAARDWTRAGSLMQKYSSDYLKRGEVLTVVGWFQTLPEAVVLSDPRLCLEYCWPLLLAGLFDLASPLLERLEQMATDISPFLGEVYTAQAYLARGLGYHERMIERSRQALELLPKSSMTSRGIVALNLGLDYWHTGQMHAAEKVLTEALEVARSTGNHYAALTALIFLGRVLAVRGQLRQAAEFFQDAIQQGADLPVTALAYMDFAALHYEWNNLDVSDRYLRKAIALCQHSQNDEFLVGCWLLSLRLRIAQGDLPGAEEVLGHAIRLVRTGKIPEPMAKRVDVAQVYLWLEKGKPIGEWEDMLAEQVDCHPFYRFLSVTKSRTVPVAQARIYLDALGQAALANEWVYGLIAVRALQASMAETQLKAQDYLLDALRLANSGGFIRTFLEVGEKLIPVLQEITRKSNFPGDARQILALLTTQDETSGEGLISLIEPLSERELEVLQLVTTGLSNREIAEKLIISTGTAKSHIHHLCGKLGVRNRTEAAMKAKELGLV